MATRVHIQVRGIVQGVGFRPFVFSQARRRSLRGLVLNNTSGVLIDVEGEADAIAQFVSEIRFNPPPRSVVEAVECTNHLPPANYKAFRIVDSDASGKRFVLSPQTSPPARIVSENCSIRPTVGIAILL